MLKIYVFFCYSLENVVNALSFDLLKEILKEMKGDLISQLGLISTARGSSKTHSEQLISSNYIACIIKLLICSLILKLSYSEPWALRSIKSLDFRSDARSAYASLAPPRPPFFFFKRILFLKQARSLSLCKQKEIFIKITLFYIRKIRIGSLLTALGSYMPVYLDRKKYLLRFII